jgi:MFS family permease
VSSLGLAAVSAAQGAVLMMYAFLLLNGVARSLRGPAYQALAAQLVSRELFPNAATWRSTGFQLAAMLGPGVGGTMLAAFQLATPVYLVGAAAALLNILMLVPIARPATPPPRAEMTLASLATGIRFVGRTQELLASITLDLFAVLLGGATTLLPVFAKDILHVGPRELGWMLAAPSFGALVMALALAYRRTMRRAGTLLLRSVAAFGVATILFGLSRSLWLSLGLLTLLGAFDSISVVIRSTLIQQLTPDEMRGRVAAVNSIFIGTSNELGGFESGAVAAVIGPVGSVVVGGIGTLVVVAAVAKVWPKIRQAELGTG